VSGLIDASPSRVRTLPPHTLTHMSSLRRAFTLVELLVVIAMIGILVGLAAPAIQAMRESSRRAGCQSRLTPIGMALQSYHDRWLHFPVGTVADSGPVQSEAAGNHHNWLGRLLGGLDQPVIASRIDRSTSVYDESNSAVLELMYSGVKCPSDGRYPANASSYVGFHHPTEKPINDTDHGVFLLNQPISRDDISDGLSNTAFVSEKLSRPDDLGWLSGTRATLRNVGGGIRTPAGSFSQLTPSAVGSIGSRHPAGVHVLLGSGAIRFQATQTDQRILEQMVDRRDGQLPLEFQSMEEQRRQSIQ
jgi:prepilin-type N-terminal cleavage/methylation domain-containing protein